MTVTFDPDRAITRRFEESASRLWDDLCGDDARSCLGKRGRVSRLASLWAGVHHVDPKPVERVLRGIVRDEDSLARDEPLPWYLRNFFRHIHDEIRRHPEGDVGYRITVKACNEHYWYAMQQIPTEHGCLARESGFSCSPYFKEATPPQSKKERADVRGMADTLLFLAPEIMCAYGAKTTRGKSRAALEERADRELEYLLRWFTVRLDCAVMSHGECELRLNIDPSVSVSKSIDLPWDHQRVLVSSPNVRRAILSLSDAWTAPSPKAVVCAWTGSGKEVMVELLSQARRVDADHRCTLSAPELESFERFRKAVAERTGCFADGRSILFLDEIHHRSASRLRSGLLRTMETKRVRGGGLDVSLADTAFVMAGSISWADMQKLAPKDFWGRITHPVEMHHPLNVPQPNIRREVVEDYFRLFWRASLRNWNPEDHPQLNDALVAFLEAGETERALAGVFAKELGSPLVRLIGMREFRTIVDRVFGKVVGHFEDHSSNAYASELPSIVQEASSWVVDLYGEFIKHDEGLF